MHEQELELNAFLCEHLTRLSSHLISRPITILDFGCGSGVLAHFVQRAFYKSIVYAIDTDAASIEEAKESFPEIKFFVNDHDTLPFEDNFFDFIYTANVFHHIAREKRQHIYHELMRILKPGGTLIIIELNQFNPTTWWRFRRNPEERHAQLIPFWQWYRFNKYKDKISCTFLWQSQLPLLSKIPFASLYAIRIDKK